MASTLGIIVYTVVLFVSSTNAPEPRKPQRLLFFLKMSAASCVVGFACYKLTTYLENFIPWQKLTGAVVLLTIVSTAGLLLLIATLKILRVPELDLYLRRAYNFATRA